MRPWLRCHDKQSSVTGNALPNACPPEDLMMIVRCGGYQGDGSIHTRGLRVIETELGRAGIGAELTINVTQQGRKAADLLAMVEGGDLDLCYFNSSYLSERVPSLRLLDLPFLITDRTQAYRHLDGPLGDRLVGDVRAQTGFRVLEFWDNGFRHFSNRLRPIRQPRDCGGMKIRSLDNPLYQEIFRAFGFDPVVIDVKDLPDAVASGVVDAQENPLTNTVNFGMHRTHRHITLSSHFFGVALLLVNAKQFDAWPAETQAALRAAAAAATKTQRALAAQEDIDCLERLRQDGCEIVMAEAVDRTRFEKAVAKIRKRELAKLDPSLRELF
jgi:tripartite ATP-independent transporter DctP family solute receptor